MLTTGQLGFGLNAPAGNNAGNHFNKTMHNFNAARNAAQTMIKQQAQSIVQIMAQMNSLQSKLNMQQKLHTT